MELWQLFSISAGSGIAGGLAYSLATNESYKLAFPWIHRQEKKSTSSSAPLQEKSDSSNPINPEFNTGCIGDLVVGGINGLVTLMILATVFDFDLQPLLNSSKGANGTSYENAIVQLVGWCIVGGFSGLKLISSLSNHFLKQVQEEQKEIIVR